VTPEEELKLFETASSRVEWSVVSRISLITANTTVGGVELRNVRLADINLKAQTPTVRVGKNRFRKRILPLNQSALWAVERLLERAKELGASEPEHYLIPRVRFGEGVRPMQPPSRWAGGLRGER
jgi:integrase